MRAHVRHQATVIKSQQSALLNVRLATIQLLESSCLPLWLVGEGAAREIL